jgi:hypothetical protein
LHPQLKEEIVLRTTKMNLSKLNLNKKIHVENPRTKIFFAFAFYTKDEIE